MIGLVGPGPLFDTALTGLAVVIMVSIAVFAGLFMFTDSKVVRWEAAVLLIAYFATMPFTISEEVDCVEEPTAQVCVEQAVGD